MQANLSGIFTSAAAAAAGGLLSYSYMESFVGFEDATVTDVAQFLTNGGIPSATVECLRGELHYIVSSCLYAHSYYRERSGWIFPDALGRGYSRVSRTSTTSRLENEGQDPCEKSTFNAGIASLTSVSSASQSQQCRRTVLIAGYNKLAVFVTGQCG